MSYLKRGFGSFFSRAALLVLFVAMVSGLNASVLTPASVAGQTWVITISSGSGGLSTSGKLALVFADSGNTFQLYRLSSNISNDSGTFDYVQNSATNATLTLTEGTNVLTVAAKFTSAVGGSYRLTQTVGSGTGTFQVFQGSAPVDSANKVYDLTVKSGTTPFPALGHFHLFLYGDGNYLLKNMAGGQTSSGVYTNASSNTGSLLLNVTDSIAGNGFVFFAFSNALTGVFSRDNGTGLQVGQFHEVLPPQITQAPSNTSVILGKSVTLTARATGDGPLRYQWFFEGNPRLGATNSTLSLLNVKGTNAGTYSLTVTNDGGSTASGDFTLNVILPPAIVTQPSGFTNPAGSTVLLTVNASGTDPLHYQWQLNGNNLGGKTNSSLSITNAKLSNSGSYRVIVKNAAGTAVSGVARVVILTPVQITSAPRGYLANTNAKVLLAVTATGSAPLHYQWQLNGTNIVGATAPQYIVNGVSMTNEGTYSVTVSNLVSSTNLYAFVFATTAPFDPNNDGQTDLLIRTADGHLITWFLSGANFLKTKALNTNKVIDPVWRVAGLSDFNKDGQKDILLQNTNTGALMVKFMNGTNITGETLLNSAAVGIDASWKVESAADLDGNGSGDLIAQNTVDDTLAVWQMDGTNFLNASPIILYSFDERTLQYFPVASADWLGMKWKLIGTGNFHYPGEGRGPDILTQNADGFLTTWVMNGTNFTSFQDGTNGLVSTSCLGYRLVTISSTNGPIGFSPGSNWVAVATADLNYDGECDIIFQQRGYLGIWYLNGGSFVSGAALRGGQSMNSTWRVVGPK